MILVSALAPVSIVACLPTWKPLTLATLTFVSPAFAAATVTVGPAAKTIELLFSSTAFAVETFPTSQPARVHGTHGAGVFFGCPESPLTMLKFVSPGGVGGSVAGLPPSVMSVQYLNEDENRRCRSRGRTRTSSRPPGPPGRDRARSARSGSRP